VREVEGDDKEDSDIKSSIGERADLTRLGDRLRQLELFLVDIWIGGPLLVRTGVKVAMTGGGLY